MDAAGLRQVLDNLLANAVRFAAHRVDFALSQHGQTWQLQVGDDGPGVPEDQREAIFLPFHRPNKRGVGSGLGLAIVREVVQRHRGQVRVEPNGATGARFVVALPIV